MSIQTELTRIINAKAAIKTAVEGKGVTVPDGTLLGGMASLIESIEAGGGGGKVTTGTFTPAENIVIGSDFSYEINHGLGEIPQYFFLFRDIMYDSINSSDSNNCLYMYMCSPTNYYLKSIIGTSTKNTAKAQGAWQNPLATSDVVYIAGYTNADTQLQANTKHMWIAIGGIV